jgi:GNAT superfamily N-acetyltransferase
MPDAVPATPIWRLRRARPADVPAIVAVQDAAWRRDFLAWAPAGSLHRDETVSTQLWDERIAHTVSGCAVLVADDGGRVLGFAWSRPWTDTADLPRCTVKLNALYVDSPSRSHGVGAALLTEALTMASCAGYRHAALWVIEQNTRARSFYEAHGWRPDEGATKHWRGLREVRYRRDLEG